MAYLDSWMQFGHEKRIYSYRSASTSPARALNDGNNVDDDQRHPNESRHNIQNIDRRKRQAQDRRAEKIDVQANQNNQRPHLGGAEFTVRDFEFALDISLHIHQNRHEHVPDQHQHADLETDHDRYRQPQDNDDGVEGVDGVIDEEAVFRPFDMPVAGQRAIQAVAEPVDEQAQDGQPQKGRIRVAQPETQQDQHCAHDADAGERVGHDPGRQVRGKPLQGRALDGAEQDVVDSGVRFEITHGDSSGREAGGAGLPAKRGRTSTTVPG